MNDTFRLFPEQASTVASQVDWLYFFVLAVASFFTLLIFVLIVFFALRYRRSKQIDRTIRTRHLWLLEVAWSVIPFVLTMIMFGWGASVFFTITDAPSNSIYIDVVAKQWMWRIQHPGGQREINTLHVPKGQPVTLRLISEDVIHSFYIPAFRVKQDVLPGRYTQMWFEATKAGEFDLYCTEYCGTSHSQMGGRVIVMEPADYADWLRGETGEPPEVTGKALFEQYRCGSCHDPKPEARCPPLDGIYQNTVALQGGATVVADEAYLRESILNPAAQVRAGYQPLMPTYQGQLSEQDVLQLIAYLKTLEPAGNEAPQQ